MPASTIVAICRANKMISSALTDPPLSLFMENMDTGFLSSSTEMIKSFLRRNSSIALFRSGASIFPDTMRAS